MKHFSKVLALLLATLMLVTALPVGAFEFPSRTVSENLENTSNVDYLFKYDFNDRAVTTTSKNIDLPVDSTTSPYGFATEAGGFTGVVSKRTDDSSEGNYYDVTTPTNMTQSNWKGYMFKFQKDGVSYSVGNTLSFEFDFLWKGSMSDTNAAKGDTIYLLRFRRGTSTDNNLLMGIRQSDGSLKVTVNSSTGSHVITLPAADSESYTGKFTKFKVLYYDTTQTFTVYVNNVLTVEAQAVTSADVRLDGTHTTHTFDEDMLTTSIEGKPSNDGKFRNFTLCRTSGVGTVASDNKAPVYKYGLDNIVIKEVKTGSDDRVPFYQNSFEASIGNLVDATHTAGKSYYNYKNSAGIKRATETVGGKTNGYLSLAEGSRFNLYDTYQFAQNGNYIVSFDVRATASSNNSSTPSPLLRIHDGANTRFLLSVDKSNKLYLGEQYKLIPGVTLSNTGAGNEWTHIDLSVMVDETGDNRGLYDSDYSQTGGDRSLKYQIAVWVNGSFAGAYNEITRAEYLVVSNYSTDSATYGLTMGKFINDKSFKRVFLTSAPTIPDTYIEVSNTDTLKIYKDPSTGDFYQLAYDENGALIPGAYVYDIKDVAEADLPDFTATNADGEAYFAAGVTTDTEGGTVTRYDIAVGGSKVKSGKSSTTTVVGDYVEVTKDTAGNFVSCKLYDITGKTAGSFRVAITGDSHADVIGFSTEDTSAKVKVDFDNIEVYNGVTPKNWASAKDATTGLIAEVDFADISTAYKPEATRASKGGLNGVVVTSAWESAATAVDTDNNGTVDYVNINATSETFFDLYAPNSDGKVFAASLKLRNLTAGSDVHLLRLRRQPDINTAETFADILTYTVSNGCVTFNINGTSAYLCDAGGKKITLAGNNWTELKVVVDETGANPLVTFYVNGKIACYTTDSNFVPFKAANLAGVIADSFTAIKGAADQRVRFFEVSDEATGTVTMDILEAKIEYTTATPVLGNWADSAAVDFSKITDLSQLGDQFLVSDGCYLENGALVVPEGETFGWVDYNGTFANFVKTNGVDPTCQYRINCGYNIEAKIKTAYKAGQNGLFMVTSAGKENQGIVLMKNGKLFMTGGAVSGYTISTPSSEKFSEISATYTSSDASKAVFADGKMVGVVLWEGDAPSFANGNEIIAYTFPDNSVISEVYIHADQARTLALKSGNIFEIDPNAFLPATNSASSYPTNGVWDQNGYYTVATRMTGDETFGNYYRFNFVAPNDEITAENPGHLLSGQKRSDIYVTDYLEDKVTVFEYDLRFEPHANKSGKTMLLTRIRRTEEGSTGTTSLPENLLQLRDDGALIIYDGNYLCDDEGNIYTLPKGKWVNVAAIYDANAGKVSYVVDGKIYSYCKTAGTALGLANNMQLSNFRLYRMDAADTKIINLDVNTGFYGKFDVAKYKIYNIDGTANAGYVGVQNDTSNNNIRVVAGVDMLYYENVGFEVEAFDKDGKSIAGITKSYSNNIVYSSIKETEGETTRTLYPENYGYRYFYTATISNIPQNEAVKLNVTPFTEMNGVRYKASTVTLDIDFTGNMTEWKRYTNSIEVKPVGTNTSRDANFSTTEIVSYTRDGALEFNGLDAKFAFAADVECGEGEGIVSVNLTNAKGEVVTKSKFDIYVDDFTTPAKTVELEFGHHTLVLADDLDPGVHKFMIVKRTGGDFVCINNMSVTGKLLTPPELAVENAVEVVVSNPASGAPYGTVNVYVQTSDSSGDYYIRYEFLYIKWGQNNYNYLTGVSNSSNNANMYRINLAEIVTKNANGEYELVYQLLQNGEKSLAISEGHKVTVAEMQAAIPRLKAQIAAEEAKTKPNTDRIETWQKLITSYTNATADAYRDARDFVGGWHGDESIENGQIFMYIDGTPIDVTKSGRYTGTHFEFDQTCIINRCDEPETPVMRHRQYMLLDTNGWRNDQSVEFLTNDFTTRSGVTYLQMCTFNRQNMSLAQTDDERYNPENYVCDAFNLLDANGNVVWYQDLSTHLTTDGTKHIGDDEAGVDTAANRYVEYIGNADDKYGRGLYGRVGFVIDDASMKASKVYVMVRESQGDNKWYASFTSHNSNTVFKGEKWNISDYYYFDYAPNDYVAPSTNVEAE